MSATPAPDQPLVEHRATINFEHAGNGLVHNDAANLEPAEEPRQPP